MSKCKLSLFGYMDYSSTMNYYRYDNNPFRDFTTPQFSISMANTHTFYLRIYNKLEDSKMLYYRCKKPLSKMNLAKSISKFDEIKIKINVKEYM